jgi:hypothetical protein
MQLLLGLGLQALGELVEHVGRLVHPAALLPRRGIDLAERLPRLLALTIAVGDGDQFLAASRWSVRYAS